MKQTSKRTLTPKLRFPGFQDEPWWEEKTGDSLFDQINDRNPAPGLPVLAITQEHGAIPRDMIDYHVSVTEKSIESYKVVQVGDFIISLRSFQGGIEYSQYNGICSPAYVILRRRTGGSDAYFRHYLKTDRFIRVLTRNLEGLRDGKMISYKQFSELLLPVPSPQEQQKIADCLSSLDFLIVAEGRKLAVLCDHKRGLMQQLFPQPGQTQPRIRFPEFRGKGEWDMRPLGDICERIMDGTHFSPKTKDGPRPYLTSKNIRNGAMDLSTETFISEEEHRDIYKRCPVRIHDVLLTKDGASTGNCTINTLDYEFSLLSSVAVIRGNSELLDQQFLYQTIASDRTQQLIAGSMSGQAITRITLTKLGEYPIAYPTSKEEQYRIAACLSSLDGLIAAQTAKINSLKIHKRGLMQQLFPSPEGS